MALGYEEDFCFQCQNGEDVKQVDNLKITMAKDVCYNALKAKPKTDKNYSYKVKFEKGKVIGNNFADASDLFDNTNPTECPIEVCTVN